jgi:hypothetical protein
MLTGVVDGWGAHEARVHGSEEGWGMQGQLVGGA